MTQRCGRFFILIKWPNKIRYLWVILYFHRGIAVFHLHSSSRLMPNISFWLKFLKFSRSYIDLIKSVIITVKSVSTSYINNRQYYIILCTTVIYVIQSLPTFGQHMCSFQTFFSIKLKTAFFHIFFNSIFVCSLRAVRFSKKTYKMEGFGHFSVKQVNGCYISLYMDMDMKL